MHLTLCIVTVLPALMLKFMCINLSKCIFKILTWGSPTLCHHNSQWNRLYTKLIEIRPLNSYTKYNHIHQKTFYFTLVKQNHLYRLSTSHADNQIFSATQYVQCQSLFVYTGIVDIDTVYIKCIASYINKNSNSPKCSNLIFRQLVDEFINMSQYFCDQCCTSIIKEVNQLLPQVSYIQI